MQLTSSSYQASQKASSWAAFVLCNLLPDGLAPPPTSHLCGHAAGNLLWWLWHTWRPHVFDMAAFLLKLAEKDFSLALKLQR